MRQAGRKRSSEPGNPQGKPSQREWRSALAAARPSPDLEHNQPQPEAEFDTPLALGRAASRREGPSYARQRFSEPQNDPDAEREPLQHYLGEETEVEDEPAGQAFPAGSTGRLPNKKRGRKQAVEELKAMLHADPRLTRLNRPGGELGLHLDQGPCVSCLGGSLNCCDLLSFTKRLYQPLTSQFVTGPQSLTV